MLLGVWIALQPYAVGTRHAALQRGVGTVVGAALTVLLAATLPHGIWIGWIFLPLAFVCFGLRSVNYAVLRGAHAHRRARLRRWSARSAGARRPGDLAVIGVALAVLARTLPWAGTDTDRAISVVPPSPEPAPAT